MLKYLAKFEGLAGLFAAVVIFFYCSLLLPATDFFLLQGTVKPLIIIATLAAYFIINACNYKTQFITFGWYDIFFIAFIILHLLSIFWARNGVEALNVAFNWLTLYIFFKFFQWFCHTSKNKQIAINGLITTASISLAILLCLFVIFSFKEGMFQFSIDTLSTIKSLYGISKNNLSSLCILFLGAPIYLMVHNNRKNQALGLLLFLLIFIVQLLLQSRGGVLISILVLVAFAFINFFQKAVSWYLILAVAFLCIISAKIISGLQANQQHYLFVMDPFYGINSSSGDERLAMWNISFQLFLEKPVLGFGSGSWLYEHMKYGVGDLHKVDYNGNYFIHPHNFFVEVLFTNGIVGFFLSLILLVVYPLYYLAKRLKFKTLKHEDYLFFTGIFSYALMVCLYSSVQIGWGFFKGHAFLGMFFLGGIIPMNSTKNGNQLIAKLLLVVVSLCVLVFYTNASYLSHYYLKCTTALQNNNIQSSELYLDKIKNNWLGYQHKGFSTFYLQVQLANKQKQYKVAETYMMQQIKSHPYNFNFWHDLGEIYELQNEKLVAIECYEKALLYNCDLILTKINLLKLGIQTNNNSLVKRMENELLEIDAFLKNYQQNEASYRYIKKAVKMQAAYNSFKTKILKARKF